MSVTRKTTEILCELLHNGDEADRCYAARTLGVIGGKEAVAPLIEQLRDEDIDVCVDAAEALGRIGSRQAVPALIESIENDPNGEICTAVVQALGRIGGEQSLDALRKIATERPESMEWDDDWDTWWDVQLAAVKALGQAGDQAAAGLLIGILEDESQQDIESELLHALALIPGGGTGYLLQQLRRSDSQVQSRRRCASALGRAAATEELIKALGRTLKDPQAEVRIAAIRALARHGANRYLRALTLMLRDPDAGVRSAALKAVTELAGQTARSSELQQELMSLLDDPDSRVRRSLFDTLAATAAHDPLDRETIDKVVANLEDTQAETAAAACCLLGRAGNPSVIPELIRVLDNRSGHPMVRREAALSLGLLAEPTETVMQSLSRAVGDPEQAVRLAALTALMEMDDDSPLSAIDATTDDEQATAQPQRPLEVVLAAVLGDIDPNQMPEQIEDGGQQEATEMPSDTPTADGRTGRDLLMQTAAEKTVAPAAAKEMPENDEITLPETPGRIVQEGEVRNATSTLDAIAMDNVETVLQQDAPVTEVEQDQETLEYLEVVEQNKELMRRIRSHRRIDAHQDVRLLGARILANSRRSESIQTLIHALSDDDDLLRREAAEAIGEIARKDPLVPELQDAVGTLITQLAVSEQDQRLVCARALGHLGNHTALPPLLEALKDSESSVRIQATIALAELVTEGADPVTSDHMVVHQVPPLSAARRILELMQDPEAGVRLTAARELPRILSTLNQDRFAEKVAEQLVDSVFQWSGEEARLMGRALRAFDRDMVAGKLLDRLREADDSLRRSVVIEMLEELLNPDQGQAGQVA